MTLHITLDIDFVGAPENVAAAARVLAEQLEIEARYAASDNNAGVAAFAFSVQPTETRAAAL